MNQHPAYRTQTRLEQVEHGQNAVHTTKLAIFIKFRMSVIENNQNNYVGHTTELVILKKLRMYDIGDSGSNYFGHITQLVIFIKFRMSVIFRV